MGFCRRARPSRPIPSKKRVRLILLGCCLLGVVAIGGSLGAPVSAPPDADTLNQQLRTIKRKKSHIQQKLAAVKRRKREVVRELGRIDVRLAKNRARLRDVGAEVERVQLELERARLRREAAELQLSTYRELVADRLVAIYQQGEMSSLEAFLSSTSFTDFSNRLYLLDQMVSKDGELLASFEEASNEAEQRQAEVTAKEQELVALQEQVQAQTDTTAAQRQTKNREKTDLLREQAAWERALAEIEQNSREVTAMLRRMERTPQGQGRLATP